MNSKGNIIEDATIIFRNGDTELFDAILISEKGVYVGSMKSLNLEKNSSNEFEEYRFIPRDQIDKIMVCKNLKNPLDIDF